MKCSRIVLGFSFGNGMGSVADMTLKPNLKTLGVGLGGINLISFGACKGAASSFKRAQT
jgi:hypothetical protein